MSTLSMRLGMLFIARGEKRSKTTRGGKRRDETPTGRTVMVTDEELFAAAVSDEPIAEPQEVPESLK